MSSDKIISDEVIPPGELKIIEHSQWLERWRHVTSAALIGASFLIICAAILLPFEFLAPFREKAWTLLTVLVSSAAAYLYSSNSDAK